MKKLNVLIKNIILLSSISAMSFGVSALNASEDYLTDTEKQQILDTKIATNPLSIPSLNVPSMVMLVIGRDHNLFTEAYNDYSDLKEGDNINLNIMFDPNFEYYGIFDSALCYKYKTDFGYIENINNKDNLLGYWLPVRSADYKTWGPINSLWGGDSRKAYTCTGASGEWSGNFLNYVTSSRIDVIRKVLYGGSRVASKTPSNYDKNTKNALYYNDRNNHSGVSAVLLKHSHVLRDAHSWGKVFASQMYDYVFDYKDFMGISKPAEATKDSAVFLGVGSYDGSDNVERSAYLRYGWVKNPGVPGVSSVGKSDLSFIWDWASLESESEADQKAILSRNNKIFIESPLIDGLDILVVACLEGFTSDSSCKNYGTDTAPKWRPAGILQQYSEGESPRIKFGLITGSWSNNLDHGALRANIGDFNKEIDNEGNFKYKAVSCEKGTICGVINVLDGFRIADKNDGENQYGSSCVRSSVETIIEKMPNGTCRDWGNPVSKLLSNSGMYFKGSKLTGVNDVLNLGTVKQVNPYENGNEYCAEPVSLVIADESITFDGDVSGAKAYANDYDGVGVSSILESMDPSVQGKKYLMGYSKAEPTNVYKYTPSLKQINSLADVVGLAPSVPFGFGSYNVAAIAKYYSTNRVIKGKSTSSGKSQDHNMKTFIVAMKPNMPEIKIPIPGTTGFVSIVPFAKSTDYESKITGPYVTTNQIVDFYTESISDTEGVFRVNFEDYQYGSDYDMDWIVEYSYKLLKGDRGNYYLRVQLRDVKGDGYADQHAGYVITGVNNSGVYVDLEKPSSGSRGNSGEATPKKNMFDLDNIINDMTFINCTKDRNIDINTLDLSTENGITKCLKAKFATSVPSNKNGVKDIEVCWRPANLAIDNNDSAATAYYNEIFQADRIEDYYNKRILPAAKYYYANRTELNSKLTGTDIYQNTASTRYNYVMGNFYRCTYGDFVSASSRIFKVDPSQGDNAWLKSPLWYAAKNGLGEENVSYNKEPDNYYLVTDPSKLKDGMSRMMNEISKSIHTPSNFTTDSLTTDSNSAAYGAQYDPSTWWGDVIKTRVNNENGGYSGSSQSIVWHAADTFEAYAKSNLDNRVIFTYDVKANKLVRLYSQTDDSSVSAFEFLGENVFNKIAGDSLSANSENIDTLTDTNKYMNRFMRWLMGDSSHEFPDNGHHEDELLMLNNRKPLRVREEGNSHFVLGDVIDSDVVTFKTDNGKQFVVVGSNDGMLHFINDENGEPIFSYVPSEFLSSLKLLGTQDYVATSHKFMLNSTPVVYTSKSNGKTKITVFGTFGNGFPGGYALDVSDIASIASIEGGQDKFDSIVNNKVLLWEMSPKARDAFNSNGDYRGSDLVGKMSTAPTLITVDGIEYLVASSGFDAVTPGVFLIDLFGKNTSLCGSYTAQHTACFVNEIPLLINNRAPVDPRGYGRTDAIAPVSVIKLASNSANYQAIYFGDYFGNLWKIDLDAGSDNFSKDVKCWGNKSCNFDSTPKVLFKAVDTTNNAQPITAKIGATYINNGLSLVFGTGSYVNDIDNKGVSKRYNTFQSIYSLRDMTAQNSISNPVNGQVLRCANDSQTNCVSRAKFVEGTQVRTFNVNSSVSSYGWYVDLSNDGKTAFSGERVYTNPLLLSGKGYITTNTPNTDDPCAGSGVSTLMMIDVLSASMNQMDAYNSLSKSPTITLHNGNLVIHVTHDSGDTRPDPDPDDHKPNKPLFNEHTYPGTIGNVKNTSNLRIY